MAEDSHAGIDGIDGHLAAGMRGSIQDLRNAYD